jgi:hypothetical protein
MHTDEYEISLSREIAICRKKVRQLQDVLARREQQEGMTTAAFLKAREEEGLSETHLIPGWNEDYEAWQYWQKLLTEYEKARASLKWL